MVHKVERPTAKLRMVTVVGTRPELIRLSRLIPLMDDTFDHTLIHTGQNNHPGLSDVFLKELSLRTPDLYLHIDNSSLGSQLAGVLQGVESALKDLQPDGLVVLGDTNSSIAALIAKRMGIAVYHLEAGNRSFDENVPEETNRRVVDHLAHFNLPYSERARDNLIAEGIHPRTICVSGSPLAEVFSYYRNRIVTSPVLSDLGVEPDSYLVASIHRQENVDDPEILGQVIQALETLSDSTGLKVVISLHPRTKKRLEESGRDLSSERFIVVDPLGFFDYMSLQENAFCVLSDSGSVSEEATIAGFPAVTLRAAIERQETLDAGGIVVSGLSPKVLATAVDYVRRRGRTRTPDDYAHEDFSHRVVSFILSTIGQFKVTFRLN